MVKEKINMEKEFNLSEKICEDEFKIKECYWIFAEDVKEFIRRLKKDKCFCSAGEPCTHHKTIDKLAGKSLI